MQIVYVIFSIFLAFYGNNWTFIKKYKPVSIFQPILINILPIYLVYFRISERLLQICKINPISVYFPTQKIQFSASLKHFTKCLCVFFLTFVLFYINMHFAFFFSIFSTFRCFTQRNILRFFLFSSFNNKISFRFSVNPSFKNSDI